MIDLRNLGNFKTVLEFLVSLQDVPELAAPTSQLSAESMVTTEAQTTAAIVGAPLTDLTLSIKAMSVVSVTSQCSYSSTIVHVPQPESGTSTFSSFHPGGFTI